MKKQVSLLATAMFVSLPLAAAEEPAAKSPWKASAELGYVATSGNTETETLNAKMAVANERDKWRHEGEITAMNASDEVQTTAEKYTLFAQSNYKMSEIDFIFGNIDYENDKFSGYDYRVTESIGYGRRVINQPELILDLEIGPGARQSKLETGETDSEGMLRGAAKLDWSISKTSKFTEKLVIEAGEDVTVTKSVTGLSSKINGSLSMKITYTYKTTSEVPVGIDDTDTETAVTLVYNF